MSGSFQLEVGDASHSEGTKGLSGAFGGSQGWDASRDS